MATVPATELARQYVGRPLPNAALLGGFAALTERTLLSSVLAAVRERFHGDVGERNVAVAERACTCGAQSLPDTSGGGRTRAPVPSLQLSSGRTETERA